MIFNLPTSLDLKTIFAPISAVVQRRAICAACDKKVLGVCTECGCPLLSKIKVSISKCPLDKWGATIGVDAPFDGVIPNQPESDL
jgi:hypothetical protein